LTEEQQGTEKVQIVIPAEVSKIMSKWGGHSVRLAAARGALPMSGHNQGITWSLFCSSFIMGRTKSLRLKRSAL